MGCCSKITLAVVTITSVLIGIQLNKLFNPPSVPKLENQWWGRGDPWRADKSIREFRINVTDEVLEDLKYRLDHHRPFTPPLEGIAQQYGMNTFLLKEIVDFWREKYDWRKQERFLNQFPQFITNIQGLDIHYIHVKPKVPDHIRVLPLLIVHGWPGSVREFYDIIPILTTPLPERDFVFEVIVPSIPGYGFSEPALRPGLGAPQVAVVFKNFMERLGFENKFYAQGGDFGGIILQSLSVLYPEKVLGFHSNMCVTFTPLSFFKTFVGALRPTWFVREEHVDRVYPIGEIYGRLLRESGYFHIQATKPDTVGVALRDSPVGLASYILEKFVSGTNFTYQLRTDGGLKENFEYEALLDNIMIYWITGSMPTAVRLYSETFNKANTELGITRIPVSVPTACARFENDFYSPDGHLSEIFSKLVHLSDYKGGHFAAMQLPNVLAEDIFEATKKFEAFISGDNSKLVF